MNNELNNLRKEMKNNGIDVYYLNTSDYNLSEYVSDYFKTIRYFTGFSGSMASALIDMNNAYIFVDGRYYTQAKKECKKNNVEVVKMIKSDSSEIFEHIKNKYAHMTIGLDAKRSSTYFVNELLKINKNIKTLDIYSKIIKNRIQPENLEIIELPVKYTGRSRKDKVKDLINYYEDKTHIVNNLESIAYITNLRSEDIPHNPVFISYLVLLDKKVYLFVDRKRINNKILNSLIVDNIVVKDYNEYYDFIKDICYKEISFDDNKVNYETYSLVKDNNIIDFSVSYIENAKSIKNNIEIENIKLAHIYDGVSMVRFIKWIKETNKTELTECIARDYLDNLRLKNHAFDLSFDSIVAYNSNAAMMHYSPSIKKDVKLKNSGILLVDSGGQYLHGTTDITRTISLGPVSNTIKKHFTLVLRSMFNLSNAKFLDSMTGRTLDVLARINIWKEGIDYRCGTGHGVGHILSVHEAPPNIRFRKTNSKSEEIELVPGMIFSDEPGIYVEDEYGIRCENLLLCKKDEKNEYGQFLSFETITMCPFDLDLIDKKYLDKDTLDSLNRYHQKVYSVLSLFLNDEEKKFLKKETRSI